MTRTPAEGQETITVKRRLTIKRERFVRVYLETGNACGAYRQAYDASNMSAAAINVEAQRLLKDPAISLRIREVREAAARAMQLTTEKIIEELEQARQAAFALGQAGPMVQATMGKAKVAGLIVDKKEVSQTNVYKDMSDDELHELIRADAEALGIDLAKFAKRG